MRQGNSCSFTFPAKSKKISSSHYNFTQFLSEKGLIENSGKLRYVDDDYCEISRRGKPDNWLILSVGLLIAVYCYTLSFLIDIAPHISTILREPPVVPKTVMLTGLIIIFILVFVSLTYLNYLVFIPVDYPLIFDRKNRKIYVYEYIFSKYGYMPGLFVMLRHPFFKVTRPQQKIFDWNDLQGVESEITTYFHQTKLKHSVIYGLIQSKDYPFINDMFRIVTHDDASEVQQLWAWICNYMAFKDNILDKTLDNKYIFLGEKYFMG